MINDLNNLCRFRRLCRRLPVVVAGPAGRGRPHAAAAGRLGMRRRLFPVQVALHAYHPDVGDEVEAVLSEEPGDDQGRRKTSRLRHLQELFGKHVEDDVGEAEETRPHEYHAEYQTRRTYPAGLPSPTNEEP